MKKKASILSNNPIFRGLASEQIAKINAIGINKYYAKREIVFVEETKANGFYIIIKGKIKIFKTSLDGKEQILHIYGSGNIFGEVAVFAGSNFPATAMTLKESHLLFLPRKNFTELIANNPSLSMNLLAELSGRLRQFTTQIENLSLKDAPARLASHLKYLAKQYNSRKKIKLNIAKGDLASLLGTAPETLSRIFSKMSAKNLIKVSGNEIEIIDYTGLADLERSGKL